MIKDRINHHSFPQILCPSMVSLMGIPKTNI
jgi:hypothetical protein